MIQRIQSLYLLLTTILSVLFLSGEILKYSAGPGKESVVSISGFFQMAGNGDTGLKLIMVLLLIISVFIPVISFLAILLFKKRTVQKRLVITLLCLEILLIVFCGLYYFTEVRNQAGSVIMTIRIIIPVITIAFTLLALRGITKDDDLVRSYDRLR